MSASRRRLLAVHMCSVFLCCCGDRTQEPPRADVTGEPESAYPAPSPADVEGPPPDAVEIPEFVQRLRVARPVATTVARARVQRLSASERTVPAYVWPEGRESLIVTKATIAVDEVLCGAAVGDMVDVSYVGGRIARRWLRTSLMTVDLSPGDEYVLVLSNVEGEYFLVGGRHELLAPARDGGPYRDFAGRDVTRDAIAGACR